MATNKFIFGKLAGAKPPRSFATPATPSGPAKGARRPMGPKTIATSWDIMPVSTNDAPSHLAFESRAVIGQPGVFDVAGMRLALVPPPPKDLEYRALSQVLGALHGLYVNREELKTIRPGYHKPISLLATGCSSCAISFRADDDDRTVRATYFITDYLDSLRPPARDHLEVSMPPAKIWDQCGLGWLNSYVRCCDLKYWNPRPWLQERCGCAIEVKPEGIKKGKLQTPTKKKISD